MAGEDMPDPLAAAPGDAKKADIRDAYTFTPEFLADRNRVTYTSDGQRNLAKGPEAQVYDEQAALGFMNNLVPYQGAIDELKRDLYWAGFYGSKTPSVGGDSFDRNDLATLYAAMDAAELRGGVDVIDLVDGLAQAGRKRNAPLGSEVDPEDDPGYAFMEFAKKNGITLSDDFIADRIGAIGAGSTTIEKELAKVRTKFVKNAFPAWADDIDAGMNVDDIAAPYKASMAQLLEIPESMIDLKDPTLRSALQGVGADGKATYKPLWLFEKELKQDERWQYTDNAYKAVRGATDGALREMGF